MWPGDQYKPDPMIAGKNLSGPAVLIIALLLLAGSVAASGIRTYTGDEVTISGYSTGGPYVYLFLTGPNLPENGVALNDISQRADQGGFTRVSVEGDDHWTYTWATNSINGRLDEGTYTIWVVDVPSDRSRLMEADYQTIDVTLTKPFVTVDTPPQNAAMDLQSVPDGAAVSVNDRYVGQTPLPYSGLSPGTYTVTFSLAGYQDLSTRVTVAGGENAEVVANLRPATGSFFVNSTPSGARVLLDGTGAGYTPVVLANVSAGNHTVTLEKDGYLSVTRQVSPGFGMRAPIDVVLEPLPATTAPLPPPTRAAALVPAPAAALLVIALGIVYRRSRGR